MLAKLHRMQPDDISLVFKKGKYFQENGFNLRYIHNKLSVPRFVIKVPLSVSKKAVVRNRNKRLARESVRLVINKLENIDGVIIVRKDLSYLKQPEVQVIIRKLFEKAGVINNPIIQ